MSLSEGVPAAHDKLWPGRNVMYWVRRNIPPEAVTASSRVPVPAAQYLRMSDEAQQYSIDNQESAIGEYATGHGFEIVKTYADHGKSGVCAKNRKGLSELLRDVVGGKANYKAILVYDVSRWGRFPNNDEAAHYEFLCARSGIPLHYCAEAFQNDGTATSSLLKALKRSMAAEFSRELGEKVFNGKKRIVQLGFWVGGPPGYGYRRLMVAADGRRKQEMLFGEHKSFTTDRVILVPGPPRELEGIREMFAMAIRKRGCAEIARELNSKGFTKEGKPWTNATVFNTVTNPKYTGCNVWHRTSQKLRSKRIPTESQYWIKKSGAFNAIVDQRTFDLAQANLPKIADYRWTDEQILRSVRRLLKKKGRLSDTLFRTTCNMPSPQALHKHFGSYRNLYKLVGYKFGEQDFYRGEQSERGLEFRRKLVADLQNLFSQHIEITHLPKGTRSMLLIDKTFLVSLLLGRSRGPYSNRSLHWVVEPSLLERDYITLFCRMNLTHDGAISFHLFPSMRFKTHRTHDKDPWLNSGIWLRTLSDFYPAVKRLWTERLRSRRAV